MTYCSMYMCYVYVGLVVHARRRTHIGYVILQRGKCEITKNLERLVMGEWVALAISSIFYNIFPSKRIINTN